MIGIGVENGPRCSANGGKIRVGDARTGTGGCEGTSKVNRTDIAIRSL